MDFHSPLLIETDSPGVQDGACDNSVPQRWESAFIKLCQRDFLLVEQVAGVDEFLERDIAVSGLAAKVAFFVGGVAHVESRGVVS